MSNGKLLRILGVGFGVAVIVGNTIGAGILRTPGSIAAALPGEWFFVGIWVLGGSYALLGSVSIAELGAMIPRAGGQYAFAHRALGPYAGFVVGWSDWLSTCGTTAAVAIVVGEYSVQLLPSLDGRKLQIAVVVAIGFALLQWRGVKWGGRTQEITSLLKALAFVVLIAACFVVGPAETATGVAPARVPLPQAATFVAFIGALQSVIYAYDGWSGAVYFSEEVRDPGRAVPMATFIGVFSVIAIYVMLNIALVYVLPLTQIVGQEFAPGVAASVIFGEHGQQFFRALVIVSMVSAINAYHLMATRTLFALSRDGLMARSAQRVNAGGTPSVALFASTVVALVFMVGTFEQVVNALAFFFVTNYTLSLVSVFVLRKREPDLHRPYRAWGYPVTTALALLGSVVFLAGAIYADVTRVPEPGQSSTKPSVIALVVLALSYPVYRLVRTARRPAAGPRREGTSRRRRRKRSRK